MALIFQQEINDIHLNLVLLLEENPFFSLKSLFGIYTDSSYSLGMKRFSLTKWL